jgi:methionyl-tRNA formyltransferase
MTEALDEGDIIHQKKLEIVFADTANTLYQKALELEKEVFYEAYEELHKQKKS